MIFDNGSTEKCFIEIIDNSQINIQPIEANSISPSSLPELNVIASPNSQRQSTESPNAPSGTVNSPIEEESTKKILKCDFCDKTFTLANVLKVHQRIHTGEKPYVCEICGKAFNQSGSLNRHRNTHRYRDATDNNFICRFCNAKFPHGSLLETHEKSAHHNRRSGRPRNLSSVDNSATSLDGKAAETFSKYNFIGHNEKLSPLTTENGDTKNESSGIIKEHPPIGGNSECAFTCPYCQLGVNDLRELGIHLSHHNATNGLISGSTGINSQNSKNNSLFSSESLVHQLTSLSKKLKIPPTSEFSHNLGLNSIQTSSFLPISFDRMRPTDTIPNMNFHMPGNLCNSNPPSLPNMPTNAPVLSESYNLAAFVLATLSKDYLYKQRNQTAPPTHQDNGFPMPGSDFLKNHLFNQKSPLLGPMSNINNLDFYNLFNLQKPLHNAIVNPDTNNTVASINKTESDQNLEMHENSYNSIAMTNQPRSNGKESVVLNGKASVTRSSPASSGQTTQTSSNKTNDIFFSRKNGGERRKCPDCDKQFTCESALRIHYRKHSGERPYACEFCSKTFSQNGTLKRHHLTCKNRPSIISNNKIKAINNKMSMSQDPDSTQEVNNSSTGSNYGLSSSSPTYPPLSYMLNTKGLNPNIGDCLTKYDHFVNKPMFQPLSSYSSGDLSRKTSGLRSPYNNIGSSEEPTDLTINGSRNEETVSQSIDEETHLDIDSVDDNKILLKIEENNNNEDMDTTDPKIGIPVSFSDSHSGNYTFEYEKNIIYNFSTKEILTHLVDNGRLLMCCHCLVYFENEKTYISHINNHSAEKAHLECSDCKFVAKDELAFKDHFNNIGVLSQLNQ